jgi:hypothetical protein
MWGVQSQGNSKGVVGPTRCCCCTYGADISVIMLDLRVGDIALAQMCHTCLHLLHTPGLVALTWMCHTGRVALACVCCMHLDVSHWMHCACLRLLRAPGPVALARTCCAHPHLLHAPGLVTLPSFVLPCTHPHLSSRVPPLVCPCMHRSCPRSHPSSYVFVPTPTLVRTCLAYALVCMHPHLRVSSFACALVCARCTLYCQPSFALTCRFGVGSGVSL